MIKPFKIVGAMGQPEAVPSLLADSNLSKRDQRRTEAEIERRVRNELSRLRALEQAPERPPAEADLSSVQLWVAPMPRGKKLDDAIDEWCRATFRQDMSDLPGREELLGRLKAKPEFQNATHLDARRLRQKFATVESKKGGAKYHLPK